MQIDGKQIFDSSSTGCPLWCVCSVRGGELQELSRLLSAQFDGLPASLGEEELL